MPEENKNAANETEEIKEPDWSLMMFWEDLTSIIQKLFDLIKSFFNYA